MFERLDYTSERQRHEKFVGRARLLARLDQLLVAGETDRWVVITGGPGMGKSALLAAWLLRREAAGAVVPHHFIRRGAYDWDDPVKLVGSLVAQLEAHVPDVREPDDTATRGSPALVRDLVGHLDVVVACAVTADGRCVVSASDDRTLKVWELDTCGCLFTHRGDVPYNAVAATVTGIVASDYAGTVWVLDWPSSNHRARPLRASHDHGSRRGSHPHNEPPAPRPLMKKHTILFLAANPIGTDRLALDREARAIQVELERSGHGDCFEFVTRWAAEPLDLLRELRKLRPTVVHVSGHGSQRVAGEHTPGGAPRRDVVEPGLHGDEQRDGLYFQGSDGRAQLVSTAALEETFGAAGASVKLVVLNACYSEAQAEALLAHVDCIVGMGGSIDDDAARTFAIGFYGGLGERESVAAAYRQGRAAIRLEGLRDADRPRLKIRAGADANQLVLAADPS